MLANVENTQGASGVSQMPPVSPSAVSPLSSTLHAESLSPSDAIARNIALRMRTRRKELHLSQSALAEKSGVSLGSLKRFEQDSLISLESLIKLSVVLGCEDSFEGLFPEQRKQKEPSLEDIVAQGHKLLDRIVLLKSSAEE